MPTKAELKKAWDEKRLFDVINVGAYCTDDENEYGINEDYEKLKELFIDSITTVKDAKSVIESLIDFYIRALKTISGIDKAIKDLPFRRKIL